MMKRISLFSISLILLSGCSRLASIPYHPKQTSESWLIIQPFMEVNIGTANFILVQPSSTAFVYFLGIVAISAALYCLRIRDDYQSRLWWGIALLLWGFGALLAGTSYQAFSYEIKCAGQEFCSWTSWWEIFYLIFSAASVNAMVIAGAYSNCAGKWRKVLIFYAFVNLTLYAVAVLIGVLTLNKFLISFELLLIITAPNILLLFILNALQYFKLRKHMDFTLMITWLWLGFTISLYFLYWSLDITNNLWELGIWFSENDVLHIGLIIWMVYIAVYVAKHLVDEPTPFLESSES